MIRINLLPWREERRALQQRFFVYMLAAGAVIALGIMFGVHMYMENLIENQRARNQFLQAEIDKLKGADEEIKRIEKVRSGLLARLDVVKNLQESRPGVVMVFDTLVRRLPPNIYLTGFNTAGQAVTFNGVAESNNVISDFMRQLTLSGLFTEPVLTVIENKEVNKVKASVFELKTSWKKPSPEAQAGSSQPSPPPKK